MAGVMFVTDYADRALFLPEPRYAELRLLLGQALLRQTAAGGAVDFTDLARFAAALGEPKLFLTLRDQRWVELLHEQLTIRRTLPVRLRRTCGICGEQTFTDPGGDSVQEAQAIGQSLELLGDGHPFLAVLSFLGSAAQADACPRCAGTTFQEAPVTFCPQCREVRAESLLLSCPGCSYGFRGDDVPIWTTRSAASAAMRTSRNVDAFAEKAVLFERGLYQGQREAITSAIGPDEVLVGMCRCALPGHALRTVALLFTSERLIWAREAAFSGTSGGAVNWRDVTEVVAYQPEKLPPGIELRSGRELSIFADFRGKGVLFEGEEAAFDLAGVLELVTRLCEAHRPPAHLTAQRAVSREPV